MINGKTKVCCVVGNPIAHSLSPLLHNTAFRVLGLDFIYVPFLIKNIERAVHAIRELGICGVSITVPHKTVALNYLDSVDHSALKIGAVNTIVNKNGKLIGYNTDAAAAIKALEEKTNLQGKSVVLVGSGGAAAAIAFGLIRKSVQLTILNRTIEKARLLVQRLGAGDYGGLDKLSVVKNSDVLINATTTGMLQDTASSVIPAELLHRGLTVFDVVYNPKDTLLLKSALAKGADVVYGYKMLLYQAAAQFALFTGSSAPLPEMEESLINALGGVVKHA